jgi:hypothetical protein
VTATQRQGIRLCACPMRRLLTATLLLLLLLPAAHALAGDNASDLLIDACRDEHVEGTYSQRTYKRALDELPADSDQYTACRDVIERARIAALQKRSSGGGSRDSGRASTAPAPSTGGGSGSGSDSGSGGGGGGGSATPAPSVAPAPAATPRRSSGASKPKRTPRSSEAPATTTTTAPAAEPPVLPVGPVGDVTAPATRLPSAIVVLLAALALAVLLAVSTLAWNRVVVRRR